MKKKFLSGILAGILTFTPFFASAEYGIYYGTSQKYANKTIGFDTMIVEPYNFKLYKNYTGKKICYLTVGEFDGTADELGNLGLSGAVVGYNSNWNSYIMNMSDTKWQSYLVSEEFKLKNMGCDGLFLDTIWQEGQQQGGIQIVKKMRENWTGAYIVPNNAHFIRYDILSYVDAFMFENFWETNTVDGGEDALWLEEQMQEYQKLVKGTNVKLLAISYGNPFLSKNKKWAIKVGNLSLKYGFEQIYTNKYLTNIYGYLDKKTSSIKKLPGVR